MPVVEKHVYSTGEERYSFHCPACSTRHAYTTKRGKDERGQEYPGPCWSFNGDMEKPTFRPSLLYPTGKPPCHLHVTAGKIEYCDDAGHSLAGKVIPMQQVEL